jgi:AcrR family transcriptional regulator
MSSTEAGGRRPSRRDANIAATRTALLAVARAHFARDGFACGEVGRIAAEAGVTTGALYHHFGSKKGLFQAVAEQIEGDILAEAAAAEGADPWARLRAGFERLIDVCAAPDIQRIIFVEAAQVIGAEAWRAIELRYAYGATRAAIGGLMAAGVLRQAPVDLVARALLVLLGEAAAEVARAGGDAGVRAQVAELMRALLDALAVR